MLTWLGTMGSRAGKICCKNGSTPSQAEDPSVAKGVPTQLLPDLCVVCVWGVPVRCFSKLVPESTQPPKWWQQGWARQRAGSVAEAELLAPLGELLMPGMPLEEMFRSFSSPPGWGGHYLEPDLAAYGVLKDNQAALFVEYDGHYRHGTKAGMANDCMKNAALLGFAPAGSYVVRINHENKCATEENVLWVSVNTWRQGDHKSFARSFKSLAEETVLRLQHALHPFVRKRFEAHLSNKREFMISRSAREYREAAVVQGRGSTTQEIRNFLIAEGFGPADIDRLLKHALIGGLSKESRLQPLLKFLFGLGLNHSQVAKALTTYPQILSLSIKQNLTPTVHWFLDLGLTKRQVAKAVATVPPILWYSIEQNLEPTVKYFLDLGLTKRQVAKAVVLFPQFLGLSIKQNLRPTVQWLVELGLTKAEVAKAVARYPQFLGLSTEQNLKPTVQWFLEFGLTKRHVAEAVAKSPQLLSLSIEQNLKPTVQWFLDFGLTKGQVARAVTLFSRLLCYSIEQNLKPTVQFFLDVGLAKGQVVKAVATSPQILSLSVEKNLKPTVQWFLDLGLTKRQIAGVVARHPPILWYSTEQNLSPKMLLLNDFFAAKGAAEMVAQWPQLLGYSYQRLTTRLKILAERDKTDKLISVMSLTEEAFQRRFLKDPKKRPKDPNSLLFNSMFGFDVTWDAGNLMQ